MDGQSESPHWHLILTVLFSLLVVYASRITYLQYSNPLRKIPGPWLARYTRFWLWKSVVSRDWHRICLASHRRYGPIVRIAPNEYSIDDPEAPKIIFRSRNQLEKAPWYHVFTAPGEPDSMFTMAGNQRHLQRRRQVNEFYTTGAINRLAYRAHQVSRLFFDKLAHQARSRGDNPFDICQMIRYYVYDALANITFGQVFGCLENNSDINGLIVTTAAFMRYGTVVGPFVEWHPVIIRLLQTLAPGGKRGLLHAKSIGEKAMSDMEESSASKKAGPEKGHQAPHSLVGTMQEKHLRDPSTFTRDDVTYHMLPNIIAGAASTTATLSAVLYYLCRNPRVLARLRDELDQWAAAKEQKTVGEAFSTTAPQDLPYLQAVLKETLRIFPLGVNQVRVVPEGGLTIADQFFPAGTLVGMNAYATHANRDVFGLDADDFRPERWLGHDETVTQMDQYMLSFGHGPRNCIGRNIAHLLLNALIPELVLRFDFMLMEPDKEWTVYNDTFMYQKDLLVKVRERVMADAV
ncbi:MAG: hypothetical protein LQ349_002532 [Xanthoria aureola]|nr:MAG: hypothetical protein LQ349_002532 [Xanthoria aureola]